VAQWGTVAVDRDVIELGSRLRIEGFPDTTFRAEDVGGGVKVNHIDILFPSHKEHLIFGEKEMVVYRNRKTCLERSDIKAEVND
jgi:3D (Asp-Asp-Asp) domain-containing protein